MLKVLPSHISNLIAAGEVVQRPASVVKELMENAVDAGASSIQVIIKDSGRTLIQIIDDGCGMSPQDAKLAFLRHATSKLTTIEDLDSISTFGFRGEALASVAAVAEVGLKTKRDEDETGFEVKFAESKLFQESPTACPKGSNFSVRNIFYNIPARRKFLKSDAAEYRQILSEFTRIALTRPNLSFKLTHNDSEIYNLHPSNLKQRILSLMGKDYVKELVEVSVNTSIVSIKGYIGKPEDSRKTGGNQYFFVNNRFFRSAYFQKAVLKAYENLIIEGTTPSFFIYLDVDQDKIDINIHPSKTEVKFEDDSAIFEILLSVTKESLGKNSFMPSIDFDQEGAPDIPMVKNNFYTPPPKVNYNPLFNPFNERESITNFELEGFEKKPYSDPAAKDDYQTLLFKDSALSQKPILQISNKYIITTIKSGLLVINIRRAQERVLFERYLNSINNRQTIIQQNLFPTTIELSESSYSFLMEEMDIITQLGFDIRFPDSKSETRGNFITIYGLPSGFTDDLDMLSQIVDNLIFELSDFGRNFENQNKEKLALALAKAGSSGRISTLNVFEAQLLIDKLYGCSEPMFTPSGKSCMTIITTEEIDNRL